MPSTEQMYHSNIPQIDRDIKKHVLTETIPSPRYSYRVSCVRYLPPQNKTRFLNFWKNLLTIIVYRSTMTRVSRVHPTGHQTRDAPN